MVKPDNMSKQKKEQHKSTDWTSEENCGENVRETPIFFTTVLTGHKSINHHLSLKCQTLVLSRVYL